MVFETRILIDDEAIKSIVKEFSGSYKANFNYKLKYSSIRFIVCAKALSVMKYNDFNRIFYL